MWSLILIILIGVGVSGDVAYDTLIKHRLKKWEEGISRDANGVRHGCREFTVGDGKIALLLIHGFGDSPAVYTNFAPALAEEGFTCRVMRLPGFAEPITEYAKTNSGLWLKTVGEEIHQLQQKHEQVWIIAHSLGGAITIRYLLEHSQKVDGVVLLAPLFKVSNHRSPMLSARAWHEIGSCCLLTSRIFENYLPIDAHNIEVKQRHQILCDRFIPKVIYDELFRLLDSIKGKACELKLPLLMILAQDDEVVDNKTAERFYQEASSIHKSIIILKNSGHVIPLDYEWKEAASAISRFIVSVNS